MSRFEFATRLVELFNIVNLADTDMPADWTIPSQARTVGRPLLEALREVLSPEEYKIWLDSGSLPDIKS